jgi:hypothetical protein
VLQFFLTPFYLSSEPQRAPQIGAIFFFVRSSRSSAREMLIVWKPLDDLLNEGLAPKISRVDWYAPKTAGAFFAAKEELVPPLLSPNDLPLTI